MPGALEGVRVADFSRVLAGPYATMLLADLGADVVKVERPGTGDDTREWGPPYDAAGVATYFLSVNRNKRSVAIDLATEEGRSAARALALASDVLVENFKPGTLERMGLGFDDLHAEHPGLVLCSITGFGDAEGRDLPGYDLVLQAVGGLMSITGPEPGAPTKVGVALVDVVAGLHATAGILAALRHRDRTGEGQRVEISLLSSLLSALVNQASGYVSAGVVPGILGNAHPSIAPYEVYQVADGHFVVAVGNDRQFVALCAVVERPELAEDPRFLTNADRVRNRADLNRELSPALSTRAGSQWFDALRAVGVPCGPINDLGGAFAFAESLGLDPVVEIEGDAGAAASRQVRNPIGMSVTPPEYASAPPSLGRDTEAVLRDLGLGLAHDDPS